MDRLVQSWKVTLQVTFALLCLGPGSLSCPGQPTPATTHTHTQVCQQLFWAHLLLFCQSWHISMWGHGAACEIGAACPARNPPLRRRGRLWQRLIGRLRPWVSDDTVKIIKDRDGNKESLEGIIKEISIQRTFADKRGGKWRQRRPALGKQRGRRNRPAKPSSTDPRGNSTVRPGTHMGRTAHEIGNLALGALSLPFARIQWQTRTHIQAKFGNKHRVQILKSNSEASDLTWGLGCNICVHTHRCPRGLRNIFIPHLFLHPFIKFYKMKNIYIQREEENK